MTDITLGRPVGPFFWRGGVVGELCFCTVAWDCQYDSAEPIAIPPTIYQVGNDIIVTNTVEACKNASQYVSPGVLTMTPTVTCQDYDGGPPQVVVLNPIYLTITEGECYITQPCDFPVNPSFETGNASGWSNLLGNIVTSPVYDGQYAFAATSTGLTLEQTVGGLNLASDTQFIFSCKAQTTIGPTQPLNMEIRWFDGTGSLINLAQQSWQLVVGAWSSPYVVGVVPTNAVSMLCYCWSPAEGPVVDFFTLSPCPSQL